MSTAVQDPTCVDQAAPPIDQVAHVISSDKGRSVSERLVILAALGAASGSAAATLFAGGDLELTMFMVAAVVAALVCFDTALERRARSSRAWLLAAAAPLCKAAPTIWFALSPDSGRWEQRYDHVGSLLFVAVLAVAVLPMVRPARSRAPYLGHINAIVVLACGVGLAIAGASVGFVTDPTFGATTTQRLIETISWGATGVALASVAIIAGHSTRLSGALIALLATVAAAAAVLAVSNAGRSVDLGWFAVLFAGLAWSAVGFGPGALGGRRDRSRATAAPALVAVTAGLVLAAAAVDARGNRSSWAPGWILLGIVSVVLLAVAIFGRELLRSLGGIPASSRQTKFRSATDPDSAADFFDEISQAAAVIDVSNRFEPPAATFSDQANPETESLSDPSVISAIRRAHEDPDAEYPLPGPESDPEPAGRQASPSSAASEAIDEPSPSSAASEAIDEPSQPTARSSRPTRPPVPSHDESTNEALAAAASRHPTASPAHPHHVDPLTGLLSSSGLEHLLRVVFSSPQPDRRVALVLVAIRDIDAIERRDGRVQGAEVVRAVATRIVQACPRARAARFSRGAFAFMLVEPDADPVEQVRRLAHVVLGLRQPLDQAGSVDEIDVVAGMAQCYTNEDAASFVARANLGLARAIETEEPSLVAMP